MDNKSSLIQEIKSLIDPRPEWITFREAVYDNEPVPDLFTHNGKTLTRKECLQVSAKRHIFITHRIITGRRAQ